MFPVAPTSRLLGKGCVERQNHRFQYPAGYDPFSPPDSSLASLLKQSPWIHVVFRGRSDYVQPDSGGGCSFEHLRVFVGTAEFSEGLPSRNRSAERFEGLVCPLYFLGHGREGNGFARKCINRNYVYLFGFP